MHNSIRRSVEPFIALFLVVVSTTVSWIMESSFL